MNLSGRIFMKQAALAGLALPLHNMGAFAFAPHKNFGLQLYTLRDVLPKNPGEIIAAISKFGYTEIESYEHNKLVFFATL